MAAFESKTARQPLNIREDLPPPGLYNLPSAIKQPTYIPPEMQSFSSYGPRFREVGSV